MFCWILASDIQRPTDMSEVRFGKVLWLFMVVLRIQYSLLRCLSSVKYCWRNRFLFLLHNITLSIIIEVPTVPKHEFALSLVLVRKSIHLEPFPAC